MTTTVLLLGVSIVLAGLYVRSRPASVEPIYLSITAPNGEAFGTTTSAAAVLSPDGRYIAFITGGGDSRKLWVRALNSPDARVIEGSDGAGAPFWSPDSRWIGF